MKTKLEEHLQQALGKVRNQLPEWAQKYLSDHKDDLGLEPGHSKCKKCNGKGYKTLWILDREPFGKRKFKKLKEICPVCKGEGNLNWVENLFGKKDFEPSYDSDEDCNQQGPSS